MAALRDDPAVPAIATNASAIALLALTRSALGEIAPAAVPGMVDQQALAVRAGSGGVQRDLAQAGGRFMDAIARRIAQVTNWPRDRPANIYAAASSIRLQMAREDFAAAMQSGAVPVEAMLRADQVLAGLPGSPGVAHFAAHRALAERAAKQLIYLPPQPRRPAR